MVYQFISKLPDWYIHCSLVPSFKVPKPTLSSQLTRLQLSSQGRRGSHGPFILASKAGRQLEKNPLQTGYSLEKCQKTPSCSISFEIPGFFVELTIQVAPLRIHIFPPKSSDPFGSPCIFRPLSLPSLPFRPLPATKCHPSRGHRGHRVTGQYDHWQLVFSN